MSSIARFITLGLQDADRRLAEALAARPLEPVDRYLATSVVVMAIDRVTRRLQEWWVASEAGRALTAAGESISSAPQHSRYQAAGLILLTAVAAHVVMTMMNGPRPGWFWTVIPLMVAAFAALLLAGSRSSHSTD